MRQIIKKANKNRVHFIGIGGIGISALARYFLAQNWLVSGSDSAFSPLTQELRKEGILVKIGHKKTNISPNMVLVVYSQAIPSENPELRAARRLKIPTVTYPEGLGALTRDYKTVAIAGAHGKSTTTALAALTLIAGGFDPTVIIGTKLKEFKNSNFRKGRSNYLIIEADEYKDAFLNYDPDIIVVTNIDREHLDYYKNLNRIKKSFIEFIENLKPGGTLILNKDNKELFSLKKKIEALNPQEMKLRAASCVVSSGILRSFITPSFAKATEGSPRLHLRNKLRSIRRRRIIWFTLKDKKTTDRIEKVIKIPGSHNLSNALSVYKLGEVLGIPKSKVLKAISSYKGSWRRFEYKGNLKGLKFRVPVFDDYAHHPTEIKATLSAFREKFPKSQIICVFQPHQLKRLKALFKEFTSCFDEADNLILVDTFQVTGRDEGSDNINSKKLGRVISKRKRGPETVYLPYSGDLYNLIKSKAKNNAVVVMMGAGDIVNLTPALLR